MVRARGWANRLDMRSPARERLVKIAHSGWILLVAPAAFWVIFAVSVFGLWGWPLKVVQMLPGMVLLVFLGVGPVVALVAAVVRLAWDRDSVPRIRRAWSLAAFSAMFVLLTVLATARVG